MKKTLKSLDLNLISQLVLGVLVLLIGLIVMIFKSFGLIDIVLYISILFYIYALFSTMLYFVKRNEGDYELLLLSLINIITATFMFIFKADNPAMILGAGMAIYTILVILNRGCKMILLKRQNNFIWIIKFVVTFLIGFLGMLTTFNLFNEVTVQTMMFGFYFMSLGFMLTIENVIEIFITDATFKKILSKVIDDDKTNRLEKIEEKEIIKTSIEKIELTKEEKTTKTKEISKPDKKTKTEPKTKNEVIIETPIKKTERPKKIEEKETKSEIITEPLVKKAGRPKKTEEKEIKSETVTETPIKKAGRPKKTEEKEIKSETVTETPVKKAGRPKKTEVKETKSETIAETSVKKAGRPKKVEKKETKSETVTENVIRKVGRPKKKETEK